MRFGSFFDELEKRLRLFYSVYDKSTVENLVTAMLRVHLGESENLRICQWAFQLLGNIVQVIHFYLTKRQSVFLIICSDIINLNNCFRLQVDVKNLLIQPIKSILKHRVDLISI